METRNIFPERESFIERNPKEKVLNQKGLVIWFTGLSGSGKSTLSKTLEQKLHHAGHLTQVLDGDKIRNGLNNDLGFSEKDRTENIRRIAEVSKLFCQCGIITISAFISPTVEIRQMARKIIGENDFFEVYLNTPIETCEKRDNKGLYQKARKGEIKNFTGISSPYEDPLNPNIIMDTTDQDIEKSTDIIFKEVIDLVKGR
jgi:adenylylsulfate kinase